MPGRGPHRITVIGVGTPPQLTLRRLAVEILRIWEVKQESERPANGIATKDRAVGRDRAL